MDRKEKSICAAIEEALKTAPGVTFEDDRMRAVAAGYLTAAVSNAIESSGFWLAPVEPTDGALLAMSESYRAAERNAGWDVIYRALRDHVKAATAPR